MNFNGIDVNLSDLKKIKDIRKKIKRIKIILIACSILLPLLFLMIIIAGIGLGVTDGNGNNLNLAGGSNLNCQESGFTIDNTSLTRSEFIEKLTSYASQNGMDSVFSEYAGNIYDNSLSKNINPELVVVRAIAESQGYKQTGKFNYWGINCTNTGGGKDCESYNTFMDAVDRFIGIVSQYDSLNSMMAKYSYIGDYWYNPGDAGVGGCYYKDAIYGDNVPARVQTACEKDCDVGNTSNCVKTTEQEQKDYRDWQVKTNMASIRKRVFGLDASEGVICTGNNGNLAALTNYNLKHAGLNVLNRTLNDSEIQELNNYLDSEIKKAGYGTGAGVAAAGQSLIYWLENKGFYLQYYWGGGHPGYGDGNASFTLANPNWGSTRFGHDDHYSSRMYWGMDCSGFVSWATRTACKGNSFDSYSSEWIGRGTHISLNEAKPGDIMDREGHVILIIKNNGDGSVITAEESGSNNGLVFTTYSSAGIYTVVSMDKWYSENCTLRT